MKLLKRLYSINFGKLVKNLITTEQFIRLRKKFPNYGWYIITYNFKKFSLKLFGKKLKQVNLATKNQVENALNLRDKNTEKKIKTVQKTFKTFDLSFFIGKNYFSDERL